MSEIVKIPLQMLDAHPSNSNVMPNKLFEKLTAHIGRTGRYPPVLVRKVDHSSDSTSDSQRHQILDGHHRVAALRKLGVTHADCVVWDVDEGESLLLLATLNRLQGSDDPRKRAALLENLQQKLGQDVSRLARQLPEEMDRLKHLLTLNEAAPMPALPEPLATLPVAVHFFLLPEQKRSLEARLKAHGGSREEALLSLVGIGLAVV